MVKKRKKVRHNIKTDNTNMTFRKSHIVFGIVCGVTILIILLPTTNEEYFMEISEGYGWFIIPPTIALFLGIITVCYIAYLIIDKIRSKRKPNP